VPLLLLHTATDKTIEMNAIEKGFAVGNLDDIKRQFEKAADQERADKIVLEQTRIARSAKNAAWVAAWFAVASAVIAAIAVVISLKR
jgi:type IV secretory pathway component VirB8